jgi:cytidylate kinase
MNQLPGVITIDGPSASGKGTVAQRVAELLGWHYLDSGALYRLVALAADRRGVPWADEKAVGDLARHIDVSFKSGCIFLDNQNVEDEIRSEHCGKGASTVAAHPQVREALLERQRAFRQFPGLVADGRDMGSVIFPDAALKIFLTATAEARAARRHKQLIEKGIVATLGALLRDLNERDARDQARSVAPLQQNPDARLLDTTHLSIEEAVGKVLDWHSATE